MAQSLRDQLVKAGLASSAEAKKAERQQRKGQLDKKRGKASADVPDTKAQAQQAKKDKAAKDRAMARERNDKYAARALRAEIKQMILQHDQREKKPPKTTCRTILCTVNASSEFICPPHRRLN